MAVTCTCRRRHLVGAVVVAVAFGGLLYALSAQDKPHASSLGTNGE